MSTHLKDTIHRNEQGQFHADDDQPAIIRANGDREWFKNGSRHRDGDKPTIVQSYGRQYWYVNNARHRDGPMRVLRMSKKMRKEVRTFVRDEQATIDAQFAIIMASDLFKGMLKDEYLTHEFKPMYYRLGMPEGH